MTSLVKVGRGGAGNFYDAEELVRTASKTAAEDLEAQTDTTSTSSSNQATYVRSVPEYAYSGRGGSGNVFSPKELEKQGTFESRPIPRTEARTSVAAFGGRGGAGNIRYRGDMALQDQREQGKGIETEQWFRDIEAKLKDRIAREVEAGLAAPQRVHFSRT